MSETTTRTILVTGQEVLGPTKTGSIYEVFATTTDGEVIDLPLRAFTELPQGEPVEVDVKPYNSPEYGTTYTLYPKKKSGGSSAKVADVTKQVNALEARLKALENELPARVREIVAEELKANEKFGPEMPDA